MFYDAHASGLNGVSWWDVPKDEAHSVLTRLTRVMREQDAGRRERVLRWLRMYGNYAGAMPAGFNTLSLDEMRLRDNIIAENVDTVISEITLQEPKAAFLTDGGDWTMQQAAKQRELMVDATLRNQGFYDGLGGYGIGRACMRDCALTGQGAVIVRPDWHTLAPRIEKLLPLELLIEEADGRKGSPRSAHLVTPYDRGVLAGRYPEHAEKILDPAVVPKWSCARDGGVEDWLIQDSLYSDLVLVTESWHLPSYKGAKDGRHVAVIENLTLEYENFEQCDFPIVWCNWKPCPVGFYGIGLAQDLQADQIELNRVLIKLQDTIGAAAGAWLIAKGSRVTPMHLTDIPGTIIEYAGGQPPVWVQPNTFPGDLVEHVDRIRQRARGRSGINDMAATGAKPAGLSSGEAIRSYRDQFSMRQSPHSAVYEAFTVAVAKRVVSCFETIYKALKAGELPDGTSMPAIPVEVKRGRKTVLKRLRWEETSQSVNDAVISAFPMSALPNHPASRTQTVEEWIGAGLINQDEARALLDFPDTEGAMKLALADQDFALFAFETMVDDAKYVWPEPYQRLDLAFELIRRAYLRARIEGVPDERLELVRDHLEQIKRLQDKAAAAAAPPSATMAGPPEGAAPPPVDPGMPPPQLELVV